MWGLPTLRAHFFLLCIPIYSFGWRGAAGAAWHSLALCSRAGDNPCRPGTDGAVGPGAPGCLGVLLSQLPQPLLSQETESAAHHGSRCSDDVINMWQPFSLEQSPHLGAPEWKDRVLHEERRRGGQGQAGEPPWRRACLARPSVCAPGEAAERLGCEVGVSGRARKAKGSLCGARCCGQRTAEARKRSPRFPWRPSGTSFVM